MPTCSTCDLGMGMRSTAAETAATFRSRIPHPDGEAEDGIDPDFPPSHSLPLSLSIKDNNVQVVIRIRPLNGQEISLQGRCKCVRTYTDQSIAWTGHPESRFTFDLVADEHVSQEHLFKVAGLPMVENCMGGYNSCMFAYGQTGSGKTHTMLGDIDSGCRRHSVNCGMTPRVFEYLFSRIHKEKEVRVDDKLKFTCKISFLEIYNEQILDLLDPSSVNLQIREDVKKGVYVENLKEVEVSSARDVLQQLVQGAANRKVAATSMNRASSRSHSVFTCIIESKWESQSITHHRFARLHLVDLAGSERQKCSGAEGERLKEATNINKSLSTLGLVIMNLVSISNGKNLHVPYRDSKLTFLLQDSLGGNSKTIIIANISPSMCSSAETLSTLKFAQRAKFIRNNAIVNEDTSGDVLAMRMQILELKKELNRLRGLQNGESGNEESNLDPGVNDSPGLLNLDSSHVALSPLTSGGIMSMSQKRELEVALVGALKGLQEKERRLEAISDANQAAIQLTKEREEEIQSLRMRLRFREAGIKRLEAVASGKLSFETHLLQENSDLLKEVEVLRGMVDRNQEVTRFAMENLRLNEEIRQLKTFYEDGERERMNEQIIILQNKLLETLDWKLMHEKELEGRQGGISGTPTHGENKIPFLIEVLQDPTSPWLSNVNEEAKFLKTQAIQNSKETEVLHTKLESCMDAKMRLEMQIRELSLQLDGQRPPHDGGANKLIQTSASKMATNAQSCGSLDQTELQVMVDAIAAASQREAEAHNTAIMLSRENEELRTRLKVLFQDNSKLIELYEEAMAEVNRKVVEYTKHSLGSANASCGNSAEQDAQPLECELQELREEHERLMKMHEITTQDRDEGPKVEHLEHQLKELHKENEKVMGLLENAMQEREGEQKNLENMEHQLQELHEENEKLMGLYENAMHERVELLKMVNFEHRLQELQAENDRITGLYEKTMQEGEEIKMRLFEAIMEIEEKAAIEEEASVGRLEAETVALESSCSVCHGKHLRLGRENLETADKKIHEVTKAIGFWKVIERANIRVDKISREIEVTENGLHAKHQEMALLKNEVSESRARETAMNGKLAALRAVLTNVCSSAEYWLQREARAKARFDAANQYVATMEKELSYLQLQSKEATEKCRAAQTKESELKNQYQFQKLRLIDLENERKAEKVLLVIDNLDSSEVTLQRNWQSGKATELLKSVEERTKLPAELKLLKLELGLVEKDIEDSNKVCRELDPKLRSVVLEITGGARKRMEVEAALNEVIHENETLMEMARLGRSEIQKWIVDYQEKVFMMDLKVAEMVMCEQDACEMVERIKELKASRVSESYKRNVMVEKNRWRFDQHLVEQELEDAHRSVLHAKAILER